MITDDKLKELAPSQRRVLTALLDAYPQGVVNRTLADAALNYKGRLCELRRWLAPQGIEITCQNPKLDGSPGLRYYSIARVVDENGQCRLMDVPEHSQDIA